MEVETETEATKWRNRFYEGSVKSVVFTFIRIPKSCIPLESNTRKISYEILDSARIWRADDDRNTTRSGISDLFDDWIRVRTDFERRLRRCIASRLRIGTGSSEDTRPPVAQCCRNFCKESHRNCVTLISTRIVYYFDVTSTRWRLGFTSRALHKSSYVHIDVDLQTSDGTWRSQRGTWTVSLFSTSPSRGGDHEYFESWSSTSRFLTVRSSTAGQMLRAYSIISRQCQIFVLTGPDWTTHVKGNTDTCWCPRYGSLGQRGSDCRTPNPMFQYSEFVDRRPRMKFSQITRAHPQRVDVANQSGRSQTIFQLVLLRSIPNKMRTGESNES